MKYSIGLLLLVAALGAGCQSYAPRPVDLAAHHSAWLGRSPENDEVAALVNHIRAVAPSSSAGLSLEVAEAAALIYNADLRLARSRAGVTGATAAFAGLWDDPILSVAPERMLTSGHEPWNVGVSVGFTLPISGRLEVEKRRAGAAHHAALHEVAEQEWQVRMDVRRAWVEWSAASLKRDVTTEFLARLDTIVNIIVRMQELGELAPVQARLFHIEQLQRRNEARALDARLSDRGIALRRLMGLAPSAPLEALPRLAIELDVAEADADPAATMRTRHPHIRTLLARYETAERAMELAVRKQYPDLQIGPGYGRDEGANMIMLGLSLPIPIFNRNRQAIAEARAERDHALALVETAYERLLSEHAAAVVNRGAADEQVERMVEQIIPLVDRQSADARHIAELGEVDTLLLIDTLRRQFEAKKQLIDLEAQRSLANIRLMELLGPSDDEQRLITALRAGESEEASP